MKSPVGGSIRRRGGRSSRSSPEGRYPASQSSASSGTACWEESCRRQRRGSFPNVMSHSVSDLLGGGASVAGGTWLGSRGRIRAVTEEHYFAAQPTAPNVRREIQFHVWGHEYRLTAAGGVFSASRLDPGTAVLLRKVPPPASDTKTPILDLGCGYGPIAVALATVTPALVYAVDVNERALDLVRENAKSCGVGDRIIATRPDDVPMDVRFSQIWSNPPIRIGKPELHAMLELWLPRLAPGGVAWLVAARNLGGDSLQRWLGERGFVVTRTASQKGYRVLRVTNQPG